MQNVLHCYDFTGQTFLVTGGGGVLGSAMALELAGCGANVAILGRNIEKLAAVERRFAASQRGSGRIFPIQGDVLQPDSLNRAMAAIGAEFGAVDGLINAAGGNRPEATTGPDKRFFDLPPEALQDVFALNLMGAILPSQVVGAQMAARGRGVILNITSMSAFRPLTRVVAYSAAKAGISNFTQWLAVYMAQEYSPHIRVNALAPGFFFTEQNRYLLTDRESGALTPRGEQILAHTPLGRFGEPADLLGPMLWLLSPASAFVTGIVVPVDGGFSAYTGV